MLAYPARIIPTDEGMVLIRFPDIPEVAALGCSEAEALRNAQPILTAVLRTYHEQGRAPPRPTDICGAPIVEAPDVDAGHLEEVPDTGRS